MQGTVISFHEQKGFGFIRTHNGRPDVFVHHSVVAGGRLEKGARVDFEIGRSPNGRVCAAWVVPITEDDTSRNRR